jgi:nucleotide-binding universal stress UspA family protein
VTVRMQPRAASATSLSISPAPLATRAPQTYQVLLAHDLTAHSEIALVRAARLAIEREGHLTIFHVIENDAAPTAVAAQQARAEWLLENAIRRWMAHDKPSYRIHVAFGNPASAVSTYVHGRRVDLVVTGRHRRHAIAHLFGGTTVERLLHRIQTPLLVVNNWNQAPYRRVFIPIDFSDATVPALQFAAEFVPPHASIHLFHVAATTTFSPEYVTACTGRVAQQARYAISHLIESSGLGERRPIVTIKSGNAVALIKEELAEEKTDLVVLGTRARSGRAYGLGGGVAEAVLRSSLCDIVVIPAHGCS